MSPETSEQIVFLNNIVSRTKTRASQRDKAPTLSGYELLKIIESRYKAGSCIEYMGSLDDSDDKVRIANGKGHDFIRVKDIKFFAKGDFRYALILFEYGNQKEKTLPVVHAESFVGRELEGDAQEIGASCAHVAIRFPNEGKYDDGKYRCTIEYINSGVTRRFIEALFRRQLRRHADTELLTFPAMSNAKGKKPKLVDYRYHPSLELMADVGRNLSVFGGEKKILTSLAFTKRSELLSTGSATDVEHTDYEADVDIRVSALQAPDNPKEKLSWVASIRNKYERMGYRTQMFYRYAGGAVLKGNVSSEVAGATDFLMCPKETIYLKAPPKRWRAVMNAEIVAELLGLLNRDELWGSAT